jgi:hypothetical protein
LGSPAVRLAFARSTLAEEEEEEEEEETLA